MKRLGINPNREYICLRCQTKIKNELLGKNFIEKIKKVVTL